MTNEKLLNPSRSEELVKRHGVGLLKDLIRLFKDYNNQVLSLRVHIESQDFPQVRFIAHKLKGAAANIGAEQLYKDCDFFEQLGLEVVAANDEVLKRYDELKTSFEATVVQLDRLNFK